MTAETRAPERIDATDPNVVGDALHALGERARRLVTPPDPTGGDPDEVRSVALDLDDLLSQVHTAFERIDLAWQQDTCNADSSSAFRRFGMHVRPVVELGTHRVLTSLLQAPALAGLAQSCGDQFVERLHILEQVNGPIGSDLRTRIGTERMRYADIFALGTMEHHGTRHPLSWLRRSALDPDDAARRASWKSYVGYVHANGQEIEHVFGRLCDMRTRLARLHGFSSFTKLRYRELRRVDWTPEDAASFRASIRAHVIPLAVRLRTQQATRLGTPTGVHPADTELLGRDPVSLSVAIAVEPPALGRCLTRLHPTIGTFMQRLVDEGLIDHIARPGKATGAFFSFFDDVRRPFVFMNAVGSPDDVTTLLHESGHAMQGWLSAAVEPALVRMPSLEAMEVHSMSLELLAHPHLDPMFADAVHADRYRHRHLQRTVLSLPYMCAIDEFQHAIYNTDGTAPHDSDERSEAWAELASSWMPGVDHAADPWWHSHRWIVQRHVFNSPLYYLDYALARIVSWQLYLLSLEDPLDAVERYLVLCGMGGRTPFRAAVSKVGLADPFDERTVEVVTRGIAARLGVD